MSSEINNNEVKETSQPKEAQELKVKEEPEKNSEAKDSDKNDGLKVKEEPEPQKEGGDSGEKPSVRQQLKDVHQDSPPAEDGGTDRTRGGFVR